MRLLAKKEFIVSRNLTDNNDPVGADPAVKTDSKRAVVRISILKQASRVVDLSFRLRSFKNAICRSERCEPIQEQESLNTDG